MILAISCIILLQMHYIFLFFYMLMGTIWDNINILPTYTDLTKEIHRPLNFLD